MMIIGIDPGISGSICFFQDGIIKDVIEMPTMTDGKKNKRQVNGAQIFNEISERTNKFDKKNIKVVIEQVSAMPGQGVTSCLLYTSPSPRDMRRSRMPSSA